MSCDIPIAPASFAAQSLEAVPANPSFGGTWEGKRDGVAGLDLILEQSGGKISGSAVLYSQVGSAPVLLAPHVDGNVLTFEFQRHKCTPCEELGRNAKFLMELTGPNEASLWLQSDKRRTKVLSLM